jgi:hypothetical protein
MGTKLLVGVFGVALLVGAVSVAYPEYLGLTNAPIKDPPAITSAPPVSALKAKKSGCGSPGGSCCCAKVGKACGCGGEEVVVKPAVSACCGGTPASPAVTASAIGLALTPQGSLSSAIALSK